MKYSFPKKFLWGGAFSAIQTEGSHDLYGRGLSVGDVATYSKSLDLLDFEKQNEVTLDKIDFAIKHKKDTTNFPKRRGNLFYNNYREDVDLMKELGCRTLRISISWSRLYPLGTESEPSVEGLRFYDELIDYLVEKDIEPIITLSHYDMPLHLATHFDGWYSRKTIDYFMNFCGTVLKRYSDRVKYWIGFNEIDSIIRHPFTSGGIIPEKFDKKRLNQIIFQALHHQLVASAKAAKLCYELNPSSFFGTMLTKLTFYPYSCNPDDVLQAQNINRLNMLPTDVLHRGKYPNYSKVILKKLKIDIDPIDLELINKYRPNFLSFSYYMSMTTSTDITLAKSSGNTIAGVKNPYIESSKWGWQIDPKGLRYSLIELYDRYEVPLMIVENGLGEEDSKIGNTVKDEYRISYLREHIKEMSNAINNDGVDLLGYCMWSPIDSISSSTSQISKRYGVVYVDADDFGNGTYKRIKKSSFEFLKDIYHSNSLTINKEPQ